MVQFTSTEEFHEPSAVLCRLVETSRCTRLGHALRWFGSCPRTDQVAGLGERSSLGGGGTGYHVDSIQPHPQPQRNRTALVSVDGLSVEGDVYGWKTFEASARAGICDTTANTKPMLRGIFPLPVRARYSLGFFS